MSRWPVPIRIFAFAVALMACSRDAVTLPRSASALRRDEIPEEYNTAPLISRAFSEAGFITSTTQVAYARAYMKYFGTDGSQTVSLKVTKAGTLVASNSTTTSSESIYPLWDELSTSAPAAVSATCGLTAEANGKHEASIMYLTRVLGSTTRSTYGEAVQPACTAACGVSPNSFTYASYDPSAPEEPGGHCSDSGTTGSGIQFSPGDYTSGETVDWNTGQGNGGTSSCGMAAKVEYICIDEYDPDTGKWKTYSCGYATTC